MTFSTPGAKDRALEWLVGLKDCMKGLVWFINCGTLLGAVRGGDFIDWDLDIDAMMHRKHEGLFPQIIQCLRKKGYNARYVVCRDDRPQVKVIQHFIQISRKGISGHIGVRKPGDFKGEGYWKLGTVKLRGVEFPCPGNVGKFLEEKYGPDWRIPRRPGAMVQRGIVPRGAWHA